MDLDNHTGFAQLDASRMLAEIDGLPDQLEKAYALSQSFDPPERGDIRQVVIAGMGGSAIGADLLLAYAQPMGRVPLFVERNYMLPAWAHGRETLVVTSSHSGNTEETLSVFSQAVERNCRVLTISTGGKLAEAAAQNGVQTWIFQHKGQPRAAVGFSFGLLLGLLARLELLPDPKAELDGALEAMRRQQKILQAATPVVNNPAKRMAGQLMGRFVVVFGADILEPVARRWKGQLNELSKAIALFDVIPEANHNTIAGVVNPEKVLEKVFALFLRAEAYHPRNRVRTDLTKQILMLEGLNTDFIDAAGDTALAQQWTMLHYGDYTAYYLAMAYGIDPSPVEAIESLKAEMKRGAAG